MVWGTTVYVQPNGKTVVIVFARFYYLQAANWCLEKDWWLIPLHCSDFNNQLSRAMKLVIILITFGILTGCQNVYKKFYKESSAYNPDNIVFHQSEAKVVFSSDLRKDLLSFQRQGYNVIGTSDFHSSSITSVEQKIKDFALEIGAEIVLWSQSYRNTNNGVVPYTYYTPQTQTSYYSGNVNSFGSLSSYNYSGTMTTYSQQQNTAFIPYSIDRYNYGAIFMGKIKNTRFGFLARNLSSEDKAKNRLKQGVYIAVIIEDTPAFNSELSEGDIVTKIGNKEIKDFADFNSINLTDLSAVKVEFSRNKKRRTTTLKIK